MKKRVYELVFVIGLCFLFAINAEAASKCSYERQNELNALANNVRINVETEKTTKQILTSLDGEDGNVYVDIDYTTFKIQLLNLTDDLYFVVSDVETKSTKTYNPSDFEDGKLVIETDDRMKSIVYEVSIYSNDNTCKGDLLRKSDVTTPRINKYHSFGLCSGVEDYYLCREVITGNTDMSEDRLINSITKYKSGLEDKEGNEIIQNDKTGFKIKPIHIVGVGIGVAAILVVVFRKKIFQRRSII